MFNGRNFLLIDVRNDVSFILAHGMQWMGTWNVQYQEIGTRVVFTVFRYD